MLAQASSLWLPSVWRREPSWLSRAMIDWRYKYKSSYSHSTHWCQLLQTSTRDTSSQHKVSRCFWWLPSLSGIFFSYEYKSPVYHLSITCLSPIYHMSVTYLSPICHLSVTYLSPICHLSVTCLSHVYHMSITCLSVESGRVDRYEKCVKGSANSERSGFCHSPVDIHISACAWVRGSEREWARIGAGVSR